MATGRTALQGGAGQARQELQPSLARVGRIEELVSWWRPVQVEQAEALFGAVTVLQLVSFVMKSLFLSFTKKQKEVLQSPSSLPDYSLIVFSTKLPQQLHCS